jgi:hypothetical protein
MALSPGRSRRLATVDRKRLPAKRRDKRAPRQLEKRLLVRQEPVDGNETLSEIEVLSQESASQLLGLKVEDGRTRSRRGRRKRDVRDSMENVEDRANDGLVAQSGNAVVPSPAPQIFNMRQNRKRKRGRASEAQTLAVDDSHRSESVSEINATDKSANVYEVVAEMDNFSRRPQPTLPAGSAGIDSHSQHIRGRITGLRGPKPYLGHEEGRSTRPDWREQDLGAPQPERRISSRIEKMPNRYYGRQRTLPKRKAAPNLIEEVPELHEHQRQPGSIVVHDSDSGQEQDDSPAAQDPRHDLNDDPEPGHNQLPLTPQKSRHINVLRRMSGSIRQWISYVRYPSPDSIDPSDMESESAPPESSPQPARLASKGTSSSPAAHGSEVEVEPVAKNSTVAPNHGNRSGLFGIFISPVKARPRLDGGIARTLQQAGGMSHVFPVG